MYEPWRNLSDEVDKFHGEMEEVCLELREEVRREGEGFSNKLEEILKKISKSREESHQRQEDFKKLMRKEYSRKVWSSRTESHDLYPKDEYHRVYKNAYGKVQYWTMKMDEQTCEKFTKIKMDIESLSKEMIARVDEISKFVTFTRPLR